MYMFDIWIGAIELATLASLVSTVILLPIRLLLCFKVKSFAIHSFPIIILFLLVAAFIVLCFFNLGRDSVDHALFAIFADFMIFMCGIGRDIGAIVIGLKKKHRKES